MQMTGKKIGITVTCRLAGEPTKSGRDTRWNFYDFREKSRRYSKNANFPVGINLSVIHLGDYPNFFGWNENHVFERLGGDVENWFVNAIVEKKIAISVLIVLPSARNN